MVFQHYLTVDHVHDGDTIMGELDMGVGHYMRPISIRLDGINAPEMNDHDPAVRAKAVESRDYLASLAPVGSVLRIVSLHWDKYAPRIDADVYLSDDSLTSVNLMMISAGMAVPYLSRVGQ